MARARHASPYRPVRVRPSSGGKLMSYVSSDSAGIFNYRTKREWRRVLDRERRAEGQEWFWPNVTLPLGNQPYPNSPNTTEPITLIAEAIQPNGRRAVVAGTPTKLFRYFGLDDGAYITGNGTPDAYIQEIPPEPVGTPGIPYWDDNPGVWIEIGSGFSPLAQRWESVSINGYLVLNNGVDLPVTYRVEDFAVQPIYELRENGVAAVGNITQFNGILFAADVSQISDAELTTILTPISSGTITASQAGSIQPNNQMATLAANVVTVTGGTPFLVGMIGWSIQFANGLSYPITGFTDSTHVTVSVPSGNPAALGPLQFFLIQPGTVDYTVIASGAIFTSDMVGRQIFWPDGTTRTIRSVSAPTVVVVDTNGPIASSVFTLNNPAAYAAFTNGAFIDRIQYRIINSMPDEPRRWAAIVPASISAGGISLVFDYPAKSFAAGQVLEILGAGVAGGNLRATLLYIGPDGMHAIIDTQASTTVTSTPVQQFDAIGSLVGFVDLQDDGSGIIAMLELEGYLVVYKDTSIFLGQYTGTAGTPVDFGQVPPYRGDKSVYYRYTLISVNAKGQQFHFYAGRNSIYKFDIVTRKPVEVDSAEECKNLFFDNVDVPGGLGVELVQGGQTYQGLGIATLVIATSPGQSYYWTKGNNDLALFYKGGVFDGESIDQSGQFVAAASSVIAVGLAGFPVTCGIRALNNIGVFAAENPITKEIFFCFPTAQGVDKAMRFDYFTGQVSTTSAAYTAAAAVKRPVAGIQVGPSEDWFVMGDISGTMSRYGLTNTRDFTDIGPVTQAGNTVTSVGAVEVFTPDLVIGRTVKFNDGTDDAPVYVYANVTGYVSPTEITVGGPSTTRGEMLITIVSASWHRLGQPYDSVLESGLECFGSSFGEKTIEAWLVILASASPGTAVKFELLGAINPTNNPKVMATTTVDAPLTRNAVGLLFNSNYYAVRMTISGLNNPEELIEQLLNIAGVDSKAFIQR